MAPEARPPVTRVLDYSKYKYEQAQKQKAARKHQQQITIREIKFRPKIAQHDYDTKKGHVRRFLTGKDKVKITIMFRGREVTHPERGIALLDRLADELSDVGVIEQSPLQDGRNMTMMLAPSKAVLAGRPGPPAQDGEKRAGAGGRGEGSGGPSRRRRTRRTRRSEKPRARRLRTARAPSTTGQRPRRRRRGRLSGVDQRRTPRARLRPSQRVVQTGPLCFTRRPRCRR